VVPVAVALAVVLVTSAGADAGGGQRPAGGLRSHLRPLLTAGDPRARLYRIRPPVMQRPTSCFISSGAQTCSLVPCKGFVAAPAAPDWIPITPTCGVERSVTSPRVPSLGGVLRSLQRRLPALSPTP
jgi:hypothetical protein